MLKLKLQTLDGLDDATKALYKKEGDHYVLDVEGGETAREKELKAKNAELRDGNVALLRTLADLGIDKEHPEKAKEIAALLKTLEEHEDAELLKKGDVNAVVNKRTAKALAEAEAKVKAAEKKAHETEEKAKGISGKWSNLLVLTKAREAVGNAGQLRGEALRDFDQRALASWRVDEHDNLYAVDEKGEKTFGEKGQPLTVEEWASGLVKGAPHLFHGSGGGGSGRPESGKPNAQGKSFVDANDPKALGLEAENILSGKTIPR